MTTSNAAGTARLCSIFGISSPGASVVERVLAELGIEPIGLHGQGKLYPVDKVAAEQDLFVAKLLRLRRVAHETPPAPPAQASLDLEAQSPATDLSLQALTAEVRAMHALVMKIAKTWGVA